MKLSPSSSSGVSGSSIFQPDGLFTYPPLIEDSLSLSHGEAGALFTSLSVGYALSLLAAGRFVSVWGYKRTVVIECIAITLLPVGLPVDRELSRFPSPFFLLGIALGAYLPAILPSSLKRMKIDIGARRSHCMTPQQVSPSSRSLSSWRLASIISHGGRSCSFLAAFSLVLPIPFWKASAEPKHEASQKEGSYIKLFKEKRSGS